MSFPSRPFPGFDELEEYPLGTTFRIPPIQHPITLVASRRPSPLEPNARSNDGVHHSKAKLNTRSKTLSEPKTGEDDSHNSNPVSRAKPALDYVDPSSLIDGARKRQKLDFFQLPRPNTSSAKTSKPPAFGTIPLLNELHEPPPSAALFPPITPNIPEDQVEIQRQDTRLPERSKYNEISLESSSSISHKDKEGKPKRVYLRARRPWTKEETDDLLKGVGIYGAGKWKSILHHPGLRFHPDRTTVDLKDRYRTCRLNEERLMDREATKKREEKQNVGSKQQLAHHEASKQAKPADQDVSNSQPQPVTQKSNTGSVGFLEPFKAQTFDVYTPKDVKNLLNVTPKRKGSSAERKQQLPRWTDGEDANLSKGYQKYGFQWTTIAKDPEIGLSHRTGSQIRDRFRLKYPLHYQASVPLPLPETTPNSIRKRPVSQEEIETDLAKDILPPRRDLSWLLHDTDTIHTGKLSNQSTPDKDGQTSISRIHNEILKPNGRLIDDNEDYDCTVGGPVVQKQTEVKTGVYIHSTPPASLTTGEHSRQTSVDADETRNMNIDDLLNEDTEHPGQLPPFKYPFDHDWATDGLDDSVTLPPLLWEDMTSRPLFDL
jgi:hypothetical protein